MISWVSVFKKFAPIGLAVTLISCGPYWARPKKNGVMFDPGTAYVCIDLPVEQHPAAFRAVESWNRSLKQWKIFVPVHGKNEPCTYFVHEVFEHKIDDEHAMAWASKLGGNEIMMFEGHYEHDTNGILLHELGHALGAQHVYGTLMNPTWTKYHFDCPDEATVAQVAAWNRIDLETLSWCY